MRRILAVLGFALLVSLGGCGQMTPMSGGSGVPGAGNYNNQNGGA